MHKKCIQPREQRGMNVIGSWGEPLGKRAAVQGRQFALVHTYASLSTRMEVSLMLVQPHFYGVRQIEHRYQ